MTDILNLESFREITGGDPDIEKELFAEFITGTDSQFAIFEATWNAPDRGQDWSNAGHTVKGNALMLGAQDLADMGKHAQFNPDEDADTKKALLNTMKSEYERVKQAIAQIHG